MSMWDDAPGMFNNLPPGAIRAAQVAVDDPYLEALYATDPLTPEGIAARALSGLGYVGAAIDKPARAVRGLLGGQPRELLNAVPFSDAMGLTDPEQEVNEWDLVEQYTGLKNEPGLFSSPTDAVVDTLSIGAMFALDPLTYAGPGLAKNTVKGAMAGKLFGKAGTMPQVKSAALGLDSAKAARAAATDPDVIKAIRDPDVKQWQEAVDMGVEPLAARKSDRIRQGTDSLLDVGVGFPFNYVTPESWHHIPVGTGEGAAKFAENFIDKPLEAIKGSAPVRWGRSLFDHRVGNQTEGLAQDLAQTKFETDEIGTRAVNEAGILQARKATDFDSQVPTGPAGPNPSPPTTPGAPPAPPVPPPKTPPTPPTPPTPEPVKPFTADDFNEILSGKLGDQPKAQAHKIIDELVPDPIAASRIKDNRVVTIDGVKVDDHQQVRAEAAKRYDDTYNKKAPPVTTENPTQSSPSIVEGGTGQPQAPASKWHQDVGLLSSIPRRIYDHVVRTTAHAPGVRQSDIVEALNIVGTAAETIGRLTGRSPEDIVWNKIRYRGLTELEMVAKNTSSNPAYRKAPPGSVLGQHSLSGGGSLVDFTEHAVLTTIIHEHFHSLFYALPAQEKQILAEWVANYATPANFGETRLRPEEVIEYWSEGQENSRIFRGSTAEKQRLFYMADEAFPSGIEQYLSRGVAPTPELEGIFAKMKKIFEEILAALMRRGYFANAPFRSAESDSMFASLMQPEKAKFRVDSRDEILRADARERAALDSHIKWRESQQRPSELDRGTSAGDDELSKRIGYPARDQIARKNLVKILRDLEPEHGQLLQDHLRTYQIASEAPDYADRVNGVWVPDAQRAELDNEALHSYARLTEYRQNFLDRINDYLRNNGMLASDVIKSINEIPGLLGKKFDELDDFERAVVNDMLEERGMARIPWPDGVGQVPPPEGQASPSILPGETGELDAWVGVAKRNAEPDHEKNFGSTLINQITEARRVGKYELARQLEDYTAEQFPGTGFVGEPGQIVPFDGRIHASKEPVFSDDAVRIVQRGIKLPSKEGLAGDRLFVKAEVEPAEQLGQASPSILPGETPEEGGRMFRGVSEDELLDNLKTAPSRFGSTGGTEADILDTLSGVPHKETFDAEEFNKKEAFDKTAVGAGSPNMVIRGLDVNDAAVGEGKLLNEEAPAPRMAGDSNIHGYRPPSYLPKDPRSQRAPTDEAAVRDTIEGDRKIAGYDDADDMDFEARQRRDAEFMNQWRAGGTQISGQQASPSQLPGGGSKPRFQEDVPKKSYYIPREGFNNWDELESSAYKHSPETRDKVLQLFDEIADPFAYSRDEGLGKAWHTAVDQYMRDARDNLAEQIGTLSGQWSLEDILESAKIIRKKHNLPKNQGLGVVNSERWAADNVALEEAGHPMLPRVQTEHIGTIEDYNERSQYLEMISDDIEHLPEVVKKRVEELRWLVPAMSARQFVEARGARVAGAPPRSSEELISNARKALGLTDSIDYVEKYAGKPIADFDAFEKLSLNDMLEERGLKRIPYTGDALADGYDPGAGQASPSILDDSEKGIFTDYVKKLFAEVEKDPEAEVKIKDAVKTLKDAGVSKESLKSLRASANLEAGGSGKQRSSVPAVQLASTISEDLHNYERSLLNKPIEKSASEAAAEELLGELDVAKNALIKGTTSEKVRQSAQKGVTVNSKGEPIKSGEIISNVAADPRAGDIVSKALDAKIGALDKDSLEFLRAAAKVSVGDLEQAYHIRMKELGVQEIEAQKAQIKHATGNPKTTGGLGAANEEGLRREVGEANHILEPESHTAMRALAPAGNWSAEKYWPLVRDRLVGKKVDIKGVVKEHGLEIANKPKKAAAKKVVPSDTAAVKLDKAKAERQAVIKQADEQFDQYDHVMRLAAAGDTPDDIFKTLTKLTGGKSLPPAEIEKIIASEAKEIELMARSHQWAPEPAAGPSVADLAKRGMSPQEIARELKTTQGEVVRQLDEIAARDKAAADADIVGLPVDNLPKNPQEREEFLRDVIEVMRGKESPGFWKDQEAVKAEAAKRLEEGRSREAARPKTIAKAEQEWRAAKEEAESARRPEPKRLVLYHGGKLDKSGMTSVHLGTKAAAEHSNKGREAAGLSEFSVEVKNPITMIDSGRAHSPSRLAEDILKADPNSIDKNLPDILLKMEGGPTGMATADAALWTYLKKKGYDAIEYKNINEDPGSLSYILPIDAVRKTEAAPTGKVIGTSEMPVKNQESLKPAVIEPAPAPMAPAPATKVVVPESFATEKEGNEFLKKNRKLLTDDQKDLVMENIRKASNVEVQRANTDKLGRTEESMDELPGIAAPEGVTITEAASADPFAKSADWIKDNLKPLADAAEKSGLADKIEDLAAQMMTAKQIAKTLNLGEDGENIVGAVRINRGIPSWTTATVKGGAPVVDPEFTAWLNARNAKKAGATVPAPVAAKPAAQPKPVKPIVTPTKQQAKESPVAAAAHEEVKPTVSSEDQVTAWKAAGYPGLDKHIKAVKVEGHRLTDDETRLIHRNAAAEWAASNLGAVKSTPKPATTPAAAPAPTPAPKPAAKGKASGKGAGKPAAPAKAPPAAEKPPVKPPADQPPSKPPANEEEMLADALPEWERNPERLRRMLVEGVAVDPKNIEAVWGKNAKAANEQIKYLIDTHNAANARVVALGGDPSELADEFADHFPRFSQGAYEERKMKFKDFVDHVFVKLGMKKPPQLIKNRTLGGTSVPSNKARKQWLVGWKRATVGIQDAVKKYGGEQVTDEMRAYLRKEIPHPTGFTPDEYKAVIEDAATHISELSPEAKRTGFFDRGVVNDWHTYMQYKVKQENTLLAIHHLMATTLTNKPGGVNLVDAFKAVMPAKNPEVALATFLDKNKKMLEGLGVKAIDDLKKVFVPQEVIDAAGTLMTYHSKPGVWKELNPILEATDEITQFIRKMLTNPFPGYHFRNLGSGQFVNAVMGAFDMESVRTAMRMWSGENLSAVDKAMMEEITIYGVADRTKGHRGLGISNLAQQTYDLGQDIDITTGGMKGEVKRQLEGMQHDRGDPSAVGKVTRQFEAHTAKFAAATEFINRTSHYLALRKKGWSPHAAAASVEAGHHNYGKLTRVESNIIRRLIPFYSFSRKNLPWVMGQIADTRGPVNKMIRGTLRAREDREVPDYMGSGTVIPIGEDETNARYISGFGLPYEEAFERFKPTIGETADAHLSMLNPLIKAPLEAVAGRQFFSGRQLSDLYGGPTGDPATDNLIYNSPAARFITSGRTIMDERKGIGTKAVNLLTGVRVTDVDKEKARSIRERNELIDQLKSSPNVKATTVYGKRKDAELTPEETELLRKYRTKKK